MGATKYWGFSPLFDCISTTTIVSKWSFANLFSVFKATITWIWIFLIYCWEIFILAEEPYYKGEELLIHDGDGVTTAIVLTNKPGLLKRLKPGQTPYLVSKHKSQKEQLANLKQQKIEYPVWTPARWGRFSIDVGWCFVLWIGTGVRIIMDDGHFFMYYTNWTWIFNLIFYSIDFIGFIDFTNQVHFYNIYIVLWMFVAQVSVVFWEVNFILYEAPQLMTAEADKYGWGAVIVGEKLVHTFPYIILLFWLWCTFPEIISVLNTFPWIKGRKMRFIGYVVMNYAFAHMPFLIYMANFDFQAVYQVTYPFWFGVIMTEMLFLLLVVLPLLVLSPMLARLRKNAYKPIRTANRFRTYPISVKKQRVKRPHVVFDVQSPQPIEGKIEPNEKP